MYGFLMHPVMVNDLGGTSARVLRRGLYPVSVGFPFCGGQVFG